MRTHVVFTLIDGSRHDTAKAALDHCEEQMGAETRDLLYEIPTRSVYKNALALVIDRKYDKAIFEYVKWRNEHSEILTYLQETNQVVFIC